MINLKKRGWFQEHKRHSLAARGITTNKEIRTDIVPLKGGLAYGKSPTAYDQKQLKAGTIIEMEHTDDPVVAQRIAMDHLEEHPDYYRYLTKMERKLDKKERLEQKRLEKINRKKRGIK